MRRVRTGAVAEQGVDTGPQPLQRFFGMVIDPIRFHGRSCPAARVHQKTSLAFQPVRHPVTRKAQPFEYPRSFNVRTDGHR